MEKSERNNSEFKSKESSCQNITTSDITVEVVQNQNVSPSDSRSSQNIPYMQLFHYLKQKFPDVKDCDINESIQRFGLDQDKCEAELQQRCQAHMTGYYGPWGRPSGSSLSNRSSPGGTKSPGILVEQKTRKEKLENVLKESYREKEVIQKELSSMHHTLTQTRLKGEQADASNTRRIEDMQQENSLLQKECDIMEREILHTGEEPEVTDSAGAPSSPSPASGFAKQNNRFNFTYDRNASARLIAPSRVAPPPPSSRNRQTRHSYAGDESTNYSHLPSRWSCSRCTYDNHPDMTTCEICGAIRMPSLPTSLPETHQSTMLTADHHSSSPSLVRDLMR